MTDLSVIRNLSPWGVQLFALNQYMNRVENDVAKQDAEDDEDVIAAISRGVNRTEAICADTMMPMCRVKYALTRLRRQECIKYHGGNRTWEVV